jgi:hypothetical protein
MLNHTLLKTFSIKNTIIKFSIDEGETRNEEVFYPNAVGLHCISWFG